MFLKLPFAVSFSVLFIAIQYAVDHLERFTNHYIYIYYCCSTENHSNVQVLFFGVFMLCHSNFICVLFIGNFLY